MTSSLSSLRAAAISVLLGTILAVAGPARTAAEEDAELRHANELLASTILVDGHNDLPG